MNARTRGVVAVVDDDPRILEALAELLESAGYEARLHSSGSALLAGGISDIGCLVTDIGMPVMDGFELRDRVRRMRPELPVILISGRRDLANERHLNSPGDTEFFRKPFDGLAMLAAIAKALAADRGTRAED